MFIRDVLSVKSSGEIFGIEPGATIAEAVGRMVEHDIGSLAVMDGDVLVGFITERDVMRGLQSRGGSVVDARVSDIMVKEPVAANLDDSVDYARDVMTKERISHLIVMDGEKLVGVISFHDVAKAALKKINYENALLKRYIKHWPE